jgi:hypothetical protein
LHDRCVAPFPQAQFDGASCELLVRRDHIHLAESLAPEQPLVCVVAAGRKEACACSTYNGGPFEQMYRQQAIRVVGTITAPTALIQR